MSTTAPRAPMFTGKEIGIVAGSIVGFIVLTIIAIFSGIWGMVILGPILVIALIVGSIALSIWLLMKFGTIMVRNGVIAAHEELARRGTLPTTEP